jgi:sugar-specific transcriptional regulator TrmB
MVDNLETLQKIGLNKAEAKTYLALLYLKESKTGQLCEKTNIPSSNIYPILESLMKKGFISYRIQNNVKVFLPSDPAILDDLFDEKQKDIEEERKEIKDLIKNLKTEHSMPLPISNYKYYEGLQGLKSVWIELTEDLKNLPKNSTVKIYSSPPNTYESLIPLYDEFHKERVKQKLKYKLILSNEDKKRGNERKKMYGTEVKFIEMNNEAEISILGNNLLLQYATTKTPRAFLIQDEVFVKTFEQIFDSLWSK